jgi:hypothetical protein
VSAFLQQQAGSLSENGISDDITDFELVSKLKI